LIVQNLLVLIILSCSSIWVNNELEANISGEYISLEPSISYHNIPVRIKKKFEITTKNRSMHGQNSKSFKCQWNKIGVFTGMANFRIWK
jgi:uncharacterized lipoprotein YajG